MKYTEKANGAHHRASIALFDRNSVTTHLIEHSACPLLAYTNALGGK